MRVDERCILRKWNAEMIDFFVPKSRNIRADDNSSYRKNRKIKTKQGNLSWQNQASQYTQPRAQLKMRNAFQ